MPNGSTYTRKRASLRSRSATDWRVSRFSHTFISSICPTQFLYTIYYIYFLISLPISEILRYFLSIVPHDRKFFLPSTRHVLTETIRRNRAEHASIHTTGMGFMAIHHYANNLLSKAWRPEFRNIKTYSGFYQQEIASKLCDAERMFKEMGYKSHAGGSTLLLKGALCMDQVANVSRDALAAFVECQIMGEVFAGLVELQCSPPPSVADIFAMREHLQGDVDQTIEEMLQHLQHRAAGSQMYFSQASAASSAASSSSHRASCPQYNTNTDSHGVYENQHVGSSLVGDQMHGGPPRTPSPPPPPERRPPFEYDAYSQSHHPHRHQHNQPQQHYRPQSHAPTTHYHYQAPFSGHNPSAHHSHHPPPLHPATIPHSRSLDQYYGGHGGVAPMGTTTPRYADDLVGHTKRHSSSFDQPVNDYGPCHHYVANAAAYPPAPFNLSGNRQPISATAAHDFAAQPQPFVEQNSPYAMVMRQQPSQLQPHCVVAGGSNYAPAPVCHMGRSNTAATNTVVSSMPPAQTMPRVSAKHHNNRAVGGMYNNPLDNDSNQLRPPPRSGRRSEIAAAPQQQQHMQPTTTSIMSVMYDGYEDAAAGTDSNTSRCISDFDSTDERASSAGHHHHLNGSSGLYSNSSPAGLAAAEVGAGTYASKCSDGIGSADEWNFVYSKLNKAGYDKDLGQRGDVLQTQTESGNASNVEQTMRNNGQRGAAAAAAESTHRRPGASVDWQQEHHAAGAERPTNRTYGKTQDNSAATTLRRQPHLRDADNAERSNRFQRNGNGGSRHRSREYQRPAPIVDEPFSPIVAAMSAISMPSTATPTNGGANSPSPVSAAVAPAQQQQQQQQPTSISSRRNKSPAAITEWSCTYCTLLNPMEKRVCAACAKSKGFAPNGGAKATTTCV